MRSKPLTLTLSPKGRGESSLPLRRQEGRGKSSIRERAGKIKLLAMDVDGVLTGGEIIILNNGEEIKIWSVKDRMGFALLKRSGLSLKMAWLTARRSKQVALRAKDVGVHFLFQGCLDKWEALRKCAGTLKIPPDEICFIGDDFVDLPCLKKVGLAVCPPDSPPDIKKVCHYETNAEGGKGAVREVIDLIVRAQGAWEKATENYL